MLVHFWGVRGSVPAPVSPEQIQSKIIKIINRLRPSDLQNEESKEQFISSLPDYLFGTTGGNTSCVELQTEDADIILDAGTGIRCLGKSKNKKSKNHYHLLFSHFHWDHIQGLPFFDPAYNPKTIVDVYSPEKNAKEILKNQMVSPYFPVSFESFTKNFVFHQLEEGKSFLIDDVTVNFCKMFHPGGSYCYSFEKNGRKFVYATDIELTEKDFKMTAERRTVFDNADALVIDSQYTVVEQINKANWGHSAYCYAIDYALFWHIKKIFLFHHEPAYSDVALNEILNSARAYAKQIAHPELEIYLAQEDTEFTV